ncbi:UDP-N-acetylglucosamine transferase subunit [Nowakowskiella sp. JEL0078]|nr:UDP-N-acetylglucosamine transferase subunit [Nowakowskiella sp. JEL0078]
MQGGHTAEMFRILRSLPAVEFNSRQYIVADTDHISSGKAVEFESHFNSEAYILKIPRSREVGQSWFTTAFSSIKALFHCISLVFSHSPDILISNGPGTCIPVCLAVYLQKLLRIKHNSIIYVETYARVKSPSLTGKIMYHISDRFLTQWKYEGMSSAEFVGPLI